MAEYAVPVDIGVLTAGTSSSMVSVENLEVAEVQDTKGGIVGILLGPALLEELVDAFDPILGVVSQDPSGRACELVDAVVVVSEEEVVFLPSLEEVAEEFAPHVPVVLEGGCLLVIGRTAPEIPKVPAIAREHANLWLEVLDKLKERVNCWTILHVSVEVTCDHEPLWFAHVSLVY